MRNSTKSGSSTDCRHYNRPIARGLWPQRQLNLKALKFYYTTCERENITTVCALKIHVSLIAPLSVQIQTMQGLISQPLQGSGMDSSTLAPEQLRNELLCLQTGWPTLRSHHTPQSLSLPWQTVFLRAQSSNIRLHGLHSARCENATFFLTLSLSSGNITYHIDKHFCCCSGQPGSL